MARQSSRVAGIASMILWLCCCPLRGGSMSAGEGGEDAVKAATRQELLGVNLANERRYEEALEQFQLAIKTLSSPAGRKKANRAALGRLEAFVGNIYTLVGDLPTGLEHWKRALRHDPSLQDPSTNIIKSLTDQGDHSGSLKYAKMAVRSRPVDPAAHISAGEACKALRNYTCCEIHLERALELAPESFSALFSLGAMHRSRSSPMAEQMACVLA